MSSFREEMKKNDESKGVLMDKIDRVKRDVRKKEAVLRRYEKSQAIEETVISNTKNDLEKILNRVSELQKTLAFQGQESYKVHLKQRVKSKDFKKLRHKIEEEIDEVFLRKLNIQGHVDIQKDVQDGIIQSIKKKYEKFRTAFKVWSSVWPTLQVWLASEPDGLSKLNSAATLQGLTGEWNTIVEVMIRLKSISHPEPGSKDVKNTKSFDIPLVNFQKLLQRKVDMTSQNILLIQNHVATMETTRKYLRSLSFQLAASVQEDFVGAKEMIEMALARPSFMLHLNKDSFLGRTNGDIKIINSDGSIIIDELDRTKEEDLEASQTQHNSSSDQRKVTFHLQTLGFLKKLRDEMCWGVTDAAKNTQTSTTGPPELSSPHMSGGRSVTPQRNIARKKEANTGVHNRAATANAKFLDEKVAFDRMKMTMDILLDTDIASNQALERIQEAFDSKRFEEEGV